MERPKAAGLDAKDPEEMVVQTARGEASGGLEAEAVLVRAKLVPLLAWPPQLVRVHQRLAREAKPVRVERGRVWADGVARCVNGRPTRHVL